MASSFAISHLQTFNHCAVMCLRTRLVLLSQRPHFGLLRSTASSRTVMTSSLAIQKRNIKDLLCSFMDKRIGITFPDKYRDKDLGVASEVLLNSIYMKVDYAAIRKLANLDDTFESWLNIVYMHVWMLLTKFKHQGRDGKIMNKTIMRLLWEDLEARAKKIEDELEQHLSVNAQMRDYLEMVGVCFTLYDEGLLKSDAALANALWNQVYSCRNVDPTCLEFLIHYTRYTMAALDNMSMDKLVFDAENVKWSLPERSNLPT